MTTTNDVASESGVQEMTARYARARERVARILYVRNRLAGEVMALRSQNPRSADLARAERELEEVRVQAEDGKATLLAVLGAIRAARRDRLHAIAGDLATADAAEHELESDPLERRFHALGVR